MSDVNLERFEQLCEKADSLGLQLVKLHKAELRDLIAELREWRAIYKAEMVAVGGGTRRP